MTTTLITGGNKGLGRETARRIVAGVVRVTQAALPLLRASAQAVVVDVGSGVGSCWSNTDPQRPESRTPLVVYAASEAALAMPTLEYAPALPEFRVNTACPGLIDTDSVAGFSGAAPVAAPVTEAADVIVRTATIGRDGPTGTLVEPSGPLAW